jgi:rubrerythrin
LAWTRDRAPGELLEYCISLEANSYDLYLRMFQATSREDARRVFSHLVREEQRHLEKLTERLELLPLRDAQRPQDSPSGEQPHA